MKDETISIKGAFTCKHLLPCGLCNKTGNLCSQTVPKRIYMKIVAKCKECGKEYNVMYCLSDKEIDWEIHIRRHYENTRCVCKGEIEIVRRYPIDQEGNEL